MKELSSRKRESGGAGAADSSGAAVGKATLTEGLRGLGADAAAPAQVTPKWTDISVGATPGDTGPAPSAPAGRGLKGGPPGEREAVRGVGDAVSDAMDVVGTAVGNVVGGVAGLLTGISISSTTNAGPTFGPQGAAMWHVAFSTTGRTGWIVQEIHNTVNGTDGTGAAMTPASIGLAPDYYEAWSVDAAGTVTPSVGGDNDHWDQGGMGAGSKGHWSTTGKLYWVPGAATPAGMAARAVPNAGMLVSSFAAPPGLGVARLHRYAHANWDATVAPAVDTGSAGP
jgi:hypothetical protein